MKFSGILLARRLNTCLKWFDQQQPNSVIYIAFGSFTVFDRILFQELALGLQLTNRPFLRVVRPDVTDNSNDDGYQKGFQDGVGTRGQMVGCAPQQKVLSHPSIACFLRHCGWNPTTEGVSNGLPFLCWPYFAEQFLNESYICAIRKVGQRFNKTKMGSSQGKKLTTRWIKCSVMKILKHVPWNSRKRS